jgi:hypothetical protein
MTRGTFLKFLYLSRSNLGRFILVNMLLLIPLTGLGFSLYRLIPEAVHFLNSFNLEVHWVQGNHDKLVLALITGEEDRVYVFRREDFNGARRFLFSRQEPSSDELERAALGSGVIRLYGEPFTVYDREGEPILSFTVEGMKDNAIQLYFFKSGMRDAAAGPAVYAAIFVLSFALLFGSLGGVSDYTQRVVFHEMKSFGYLFRSIRRFFWRSMVVSLFFAVVIGAIGTNIYFYIFIISGDFSVFIAALNFWMLLFFVFILFWVFPLLILNREESVWRVMKKSLFVSLDNFEFTIDCLVFSLLMLIASCTTLSSIPGITGFFSFMNSALKDISHKYAQPDTA